MEKSERKTGGIAKFIEEAKNSQNNPNVLNKIIEAMSEKIDELQAKANISDEAIKAFQKIIRNQCDEISALKENAESYCRIMSGGRKTLKELANIFGMPVAVDQNGEASCFVHVPSLSLSCISMRMTASGQIVQNITEKKHTYCLRISLTSTATGRIHSPCQTDGRRNEYNKQIRTCDY